MLGLTGCAGELSGGVPYVDRDLPAPFDLFLADGPSVPDGPGPDRDPTKDNGPTPDQYSPAGVWQPKPGTKWQWQLTGTLNTSLPVKMYDIDLFNNSATVIGNLKASGHVVICYFSAGSYEDWRPDAQDFPSSVIGDEMSGWNENWIDIRAQAVRTIMSKRLDLAQSKDCDGVEPDNVDGYTNQTGYPLTYADQLAYNKFLAAEAHKRKLSVGMKNDLDQVLDLVPYFDWALNEQCLEYSECQMLTPFIKANKAVFHVEYSPASRSSVCPKVSGLKFDTLIKNMDLDAWYEAC